MALALVFSGIHAAEASQRGGLSLGPRSAAAFEKKEGGLGNANEPTSAFIEEVAAEAQGAQNRPG
jgi:hypothetical protein